MEEFDQFAANYEQALNQGLSLSGEESSFFLNGRINWLHRALIELGEKPRVILDYGCGCGNAGPVLLDVFKPRKVIGVDVSLAEIEIAKRTHPNPAIDFFLLNEFGPCGSADLAYTNGVFHHIPRDERNAAFACVHAALKPRGIFAFWENNPWNPGTRYIMSRVPFDRNAIVISAFEAHRLLRAAGFEIISTRFLFVFPRFLRLLRPLETALCRFPLGGQYQVLCRKK